MGRKGFYFDMTSCIGCRTCQIACKDKNNLKVGIVFRRVRNFETGVYPNPGSYNYSSTCNHCEFPKCVEGCPTGALYIAEDKTVQQDKAKCIGCRYCTWNCPYGVPQFDPEIGKVSKCNMCKDLTDNGENPACVDACVMRCLKWGDLDKLRETYGGESINSLPFIPNSKITNPAVIIKPKSIAKTNDFRQKEV